MTDLECGDGVRAAHEQRMLAMEQGLSKVEEAVTNGLSSLKAELSAWMKDLSQKQDDQGKQIGAIAVSVARLETENKFRRTLPQFIASVPWYGWISIVVAGSIVGWDKVAALVTKLVVATP